MMARFPPMADLVGKVAIVTGAAAGLGEAIARKFASEGAKVVVSDVHEARGQVVADDIGGLFMRHDVSREEDWKAAIDRCQAEFGGLDVLVNNAAILRPNIPFLEMPLETWREHFAINSDSVFLGCKLGILAMTDRGAGSIINISSTGALMAIPTSSAYVAAKSAVLSITRDASRVGGPYNVRVNAILPGAILTDQLRGNLVDRETIEDYLAKMIPLYPLGRIGKANEIAEVALFLASEKSSFISGDMLRVDGAQDP